MEISFDTEVSAKELFKFSINNVYRKATGVIWIMFSILVIFATIYTWGKVDISNSIMLIMLALLYTVANPVILYMRSKAQINKNKSFQKPLHYVVNSKGITISQDELSDTVKWDSMWKAVKYGNLIIVYVSAVRAFIIPEKAVENEYNKLVDILTEGLKNRNHIKKR